jgi:hypothetical protein
MGMTAGKLRKAQRSAHLLAALVLLAYVYTPLAAQLEDVVRFAVFPALALTGIAMWQAPRIRRGLRSERIGRRRRPRTPNQSERKGVTCNSANSMSESPTCSNWEKTPVR